MVWEAHEERESLRHKTGWEQMRTAAMFSLLPWSKKTLRPQDVMTFPWEGEATAPETKKAPTEAELKERRDQAAARYGLKGL